VATLKDVARLAEVDPSTASRVLRSDPSQTVRPDTRERILWAAKSLSYRPNALARGLRTRRTDTIGLVIPSLENLGFAEVTHGIQAAAAEAGRLVLVVEAEALERDGDDGLPEDSYSRLITDGRLDGLIVAFATLEDHLVAQLAERGIPLVLVNRRTTGVHGSVVVDDERGSRMAVEHLISLGHRAIGYVGLAAQTDTARRREQGYRAAMSEARLQIDPAWLVEGPATLSGGRQAVGELVERGHDRLPTALFAASLLGAIGVLTGLRQATVAVPADISLIAFNEHEIASHLEPPLTTVRMPNFRMGEQAVQLLLTAAGDEPGRDLMIDDAPEIVVRGSTAPPRRA
jgi:DNA-binding LacI/PurR family transcriptional regulator